MRRATAFPSRALVGGFERHEGPAPDGTAGEWYSLDYTFTLEPGEARLPRPPIAPPWP